MPERVNASRPASVACSAVNSSGVTAIRSISAFIGSFKAECKWISPSPNAEDKDGHKEDTDSRHAISIMRGIVTDISTPRNLAGKRLNFMVCGACGRFFTYLHLPLT